MPDPVGLSATPPALTLMMPWPCVPGLTSPVDRGRVGARVRVELVADLRRVEPADVRQELRGRDRLVVQVVVVERVDDQRGDALGVDDVGGQEDLHLAGDAADRRDRGGLVAERLGELVADLLDALGAEVHDQLEVVLGRGDVVGRVELAGALGVVVGDEPHLVDRERDVLGRAALGEHVEELLGDRAVRALDDRRDLAVVVLQRVLVARAGAALDEEQQQDRDDGQAAEEHELAPAGDVGRGRTAGRTAGGRRTAGPGGTGDSRGFVGLVVEEGHVRPRSWRGRIGQYYRWVGRQRPLQLRRRAQGTFFPRGSPEAVETAEHPTTTASTAGSEVVLDRYRLVRRLGGGGFGVVWLAHDLKLDRTVAVKRIPAPDADTAKRAQREGVAAARLSHPAIVALHEAGSDEENVYLVSEHVRGATFARLLEEGALSDRDVVEIGVALCDALAHAHKRGIIHRDVKPLNILVPGHGRRRRRAGQADGLRRRAHRRRRRADADRRRRRHAGLHGARAGRGRRGGGGGRPLRAGPVPLRGAVGRQPGARARRGRDRAARRPAPAAAGPAAPRPAAGPLRGARRRGLAARRGARDARRAARGADRRAGRRRRRARHDRRRAAGAAGAGRAAAAHEADPARAGRRAGRGPGGRRAALGRRRARRGARVAEARRRRSRR